MKHRKWKRRQESGAALTEALGAMVILCLIFFGLLQIFHWAMAKMVMEYASFYAASSHSLGYTPAFTERVARVASVSASGRDRSAVSLRDSEDSGAIGDALADYLSNPASSGVDFEYWDTTRPGAPRLRVSADGARESLGRVWIEHMPLLQKAFSVWAEGATEATIPAGESVYYNHSQHYLTP